MSDRILCRYCKKMVSKQYEDNYCPNCGKVVHSESGLQEMITVYIIRLKREMAYERISELIRNRMISNAIDEIRCAMRVVNEVIEPLVIEKIANSIGVEYIPPTQQDYTPDDVNEKNAYPAMLMSCKACGQSISRQAASCPHCGHPTGVHVCPKCGSTNTQVITNASKAFSTWLWGSFAANKVVSKYECMDCWHKF